MDKDISLVTIIMPAFNAERYIGEAIESVINQTYQYWELIIINDGSTDNTKNILDTCTDGRIKILKQKNQGVSSARNQGLGIAQGRYITFLDADDILPVNAIKIRTEYLDSNPGIGLVDGCIQVKDSDMKDTLRIYKPYYQGKLLPRLLALDSNVFFNVCYLFRRSLLGDVRFNEKMTHAEDLLFYMELANSSRLNYGFVSDSIYYYRSGHDSAMLNLEGLEKGYLHLLTVLKNLINVSLKQKVFLRLRIAKILFLTRLRRRDYGKSIVTTLKVLNFLS